MAQDSERAFSIGRIFSRAFSVMGHNPLVAFGVTLLLSALPTALLSYGLAQLQLDMHDRNTMFGVIGSGIIAFMIGLLLRAIVQGCLVRATVADSLIVPLAVASFGVRTTILSRYTPLKPSERWNSQAGSD